MFDFEKMVIILSKDQSGGCDREGDFDGPCDSKS